MIFVAKESDRETDQTPEGDPRQRGDPSSQSLSLGVHIPDYHVCTVFSLNFDVVSIVAEVGDQVNTLRLYQKLAEWLAYANHSANYF